MSLSRDDLEVIDGEARISDRRLMYALDLKNKKTVQQLIKRHKEELEFHGRLYLQTEEKVGLGRPCQQYLLNEQQALVICMFARTPRAQVARKQIIDVFVTFLREGQHGLARMQQGKRDAFKDLADHAQTTLNALRALSDSEEFLREITHAPIWPSNRRPRWWHDIEVREFLTISHRQMSTLIAEAEGKRLYGDRCPGKSAINEYWQRLDRLRRSHLSRAGRASHVQLVDARDTDDAQ